jgi:transcriptional regulator with XRE-family HTH domain
MEQNLQKNDKGSAPSVAIDGTRIKNVRETKKLTQLYVASVVGVTTDTISRWENNRYPTIRRDNAEKLAGALEVELEEILREEDPTEPDVPADFPAPPSRPTQRRFFIPVMAGLLLVTLVGFFILRSLAPAPQAVRWAPAFAAPGEIIPVQIKITRPEGKNTGFILKEQLPEGWRLVNAAPPSSSSDPAGSGLKWLIPGGSASVTVSYTVQVPLNAAVRGVAKLRCEIVLPTPGVNRNEAVAGDNSTRIGAFHWADRNGDHRIDDDEIMPAYYICEDMKGFGLDWKTIEAIWSGKGYLWNPKDRFTILK